MNKFKIAIIAFTFAVFVPLTSFGATLIFGSGGEEPKATTYNGALYVFYGTRYQSTYGASWSSVATVPIPSARLSGMGFLYPVEFNSRLYVFWLDVDTSEYYYMSMDQYGVWDTIASKIPGATGDMGIGVASFNNRLYAMWRATINNTSVFYASMGTNSVWSSTAHLSTGESSETPTAAVMHGADGVDRLWAFWKDRNMWDGDPMWYSSLPPGGNWSSVLKINTSDYPLTDRAPSVASSGSRIYLTYKGGYNGDILVKQMDSSNNWSAEQTVLYSTTDNPPSAVWFNGALWIFWQSNSDLQVYYQTFNL